MGFFGRWLDGIKGLSVEQQLHSKLLGQVGNVFGLVFATVCLCFYGFWYFAFFMGFSIFICVIDLVGTRQQWLEAKRVSEQIKKFQGGGVL